MSKSTTTQKTLTVGVLALLVTMMGSLSSSEAKGSLQEAPKNSTSVPIGTLASPAVEPVTVHADYMRYGGNTGDVTAKGKVEVIQGLKKIETELIEGNYKTKNFNAPYRFHFTSPKADLVGTQLTYNGATEMGHLTSSEGTFERIYVKGKDLHVHTATGQEEALMKHAMVTTVHAMAWKNPPDYRVEGEEIYYAPNKEIRIKEAKVYIRNWHILTFKELTSKLGESEGGLRLFRTVPHPRYSTDDGLSILGSMSYGFNKRSEIFLDYDWYSKEGFKPSLGFEHTFNWGVVQVGAFSDKSNVNERNAWITKIPELSVRLNEHPIGKMPLFISARANIGYWKEDSLKGMHNQVQFELTHKPISLGKHSDLRFHAGYQRDYYAVTHQLRSMPFWGVHVHSQIGSRLRLNGHYYNNDYNQNSPYHYDAYDHRRSIHYGFRYDLTRLDTLGMDFVYNLDTHHLDHEDIVYKRDLHSFTGELRYRIQDREWKLRIRAKDF